MRHDTQPIRQSRRTAQFGPSLQAIKREPPDPAQLAQEQAATVCSGTGWMCGHKAMTLAAPPPFTYTYPMDITQISDGEDWLIQRLTSILQDDAIQDLYVHQVIGALEMMKIQYALWQLEDE